MSALNNLGLDEAIGLLVLQELPDLPSTSRLESRLGKFFALAKEHSKTGAVDDLINDIRQLIDHVLLGKVATLMAGMGIALVDESCIHERAYLTNGDEWDLNFKTRYGLQTGSCQINTDTGYRSSELTDEQDRISLLVADQLDEHLHIQGYAGTGKSFLIRSLIDLLNSKRTSSKKVLILAYTKAQLDALTQNLPRFCEKWTFSYLASRVLPDDLTKPYFRRFKKPLSSNQNVPLHILPRFLNLDRIGGLTDYDIGRAVNETVIKYCRSSDDAIDHEHLPRWLDLDKRAERQNGTGVTTTIVEAARRLWLETLRPTSAEFRPTVRGYHKIKLAALEGCAVPRYFTHVIIDESHDLTPAVLQILDASPQACISLGDEYQNLSGRAFQRSEMVRERQLTHSVRAGGTELEQILNPVIQAHPSRIKLPFHGSPAIRTAIEYYERAQIPEEPAAILAGSEWSLWEWTQRLSKAGLSYRILPTIRDLDGFVQDVIDLYHYGTRPRHRLLYSFQDWPSLESTHCANLAFCRIRSWLNKKYGHQDWMRAKVRYRPSATALFTIGKATDARNYEFDRLMLTPDIVDMVRGKDKSELAAPGAALYVAITRVRHKLIAPRSLRNWIEDISIRC